MINAKQSKVNLFIIIVLPVIISVLLGSSFTLIAKEKNIILATTTSTQDTGLLDELIPVFEKKTGYVVKTIAVGSGQAITTGKRGEADVLFVHSPKDEQTFMEEGFGIKRSLVMHNDFIVVGPAEDKAAIKGKLSIIDAFRAINATRAIFISRGDKSGTHSRELEIWKKASIVPEGQKWYLETGLGMGQTLAVASEKSGYTLTDRGTYLALNKKLSLEIMVEGDASLLNIYHVIELNPEKFSKINKEGAKAFANFLISKEAQDIIKTFGISKFGSPLFFPDAGKSERDLKGK